VGVALALGCSFKDVVIAICVVLRTPQAAMLSPYFPLGRGRATHKKAKDLECELTNKYWLGRTLYAQGKFDAAEDVFRQVVNQRKMLSVPIEDHLDTLDTRLWLGCTLYAQNKIGEEEELFWQQTKLVRFLSLPLQSRADYPKWKEDVRRITSYAEVLQNLDNGGLQKVGDADCKKMNWEDEGLRLWALRQLPEYLFDLLREKNSFRDLLIDLDGYIESCPFWKGSATVRHIESAAKHGCSDCQVVLQILQCFGDIYFKREGALLHLSRRAPLFHDDNIWINVSYVDLVRKTSTYLVQPSLGTYMSVNPSRYLPNTNLKVPSSIVASSHQFTSFGSLLRPANEWLHYCTKYHSHCAVPEPTFVPRRLVFVGHRQSHPFLTEDRPLNRQYAALSYCWGSTKNTLVTKRHNLRQHFETIDMMTLPKVIFPVPPCPPEKRWIHLN
jgi:hypothetical protein